MGPSSSLAEITQQLTLLAPAADAAGRTGQAVSLKNAHKAWIICTVSQLNAATVAFTPQQCSAVAGTGAKAIPAVPIWANLDESANSTLARQTDAVSFTTDAALKTKRVIFEIDPSHLDIAGGFDCIRCNTGASNVANITAVEIVTLPRGTGAGAPSLLAD